MPTSVIEHIRRLVCDGPRDDELLGRFIERRDEAAFAALVNRHGPMVWGVCRRRLSHHDAEDAFQATFIVLARKASSIAHRATVGNWLYGVAHQTALQARRTAGRRREVQVETPDVEAPQDQWADVRPILDEELSRLPDHYRAVIVLCDLEGRTRKEVARQFSCPEGTVASRLARAREMLAKRLTARGVALSFGALVLSHNVSAVPASVASSTIKAASLCGKAAVSLKVAALTEGVLKAMLVMKLKAAVAVVLVLGFLAVGAIGFGIASGQTKGDAPQKSEKAQKVEDVKEKAEAIAWGKEVGGLQMGLVRAEARSYQPGEKVNMEVKLRNVSKAPVTITYGMLSESAPQITYSKGGEVIVQMPPINLFIVIPTEEVIGPGKTVTLYRPEFAVEARDLEPVTGPVPLVSTPTIRVQPGKYKIGYSGMVHSHPKLATGTVEFEVKEPVKPVEAFTAWGKEVDGVQVGIQFGEDRVYKVGETVTLIVRLRNNGKQDVPFSYNSEYFQKNPPLITGADGKVAKIKERNIFGIIKKSSIAPGKELDLCRFALDLRPDADRKKEESWTLYGTGKFHIQYKDVPVVGEVMLGSSGITLTTGKLELEVKDADDKKPGEPAAKQQKEAFTAWGTEVDGLQAGLGYKAGENRAYSHGETVKLVVRVRNVGKEEVAFRYVRQFFLENPPAVTDGKGKSVPLERVSVFGFHALVPVNLAPGKEIEVGERELELKATLYGTGKFSVQYERLETPANDKTLSKLATGKLELEIKADPPPPPPEKGKENDNRPIPVLTPKEVETKMEKQFAKLGSPYWDGPVIVECGVRSVASQRVSTSDGKSYENVVLQPDGDSSRFSIALTPKAQADLTRLGIDSLEDHFRGKAVKVQGRIGRTSLNLFGSPTVNFYELQIDNLDQLIEVRSADKKGRK
jgi:RNA polymerase sigma factor (sigma-70 family)